MTVAAMLQCYTYETGFLPPEASLAQHAALLAQVLAALGATRVELTGWRGGTGVAIELALLRPELVRRLTLDPEGVPDAAARSDALANEPREFAPRLDGAHLLAAWNALRDRRLWHPGYRPERRHIRRGEPRLDARSIQGELLELMKMGTRYAAARTAELQHEHEPRLAGVACEVAWLPADGLPG
jgi:pimeloyl-ACP methyl ester carboxylesterase